MVLRRHLQGPAAEPPRCQERSNKCKGQFHIPKVLEALSQENHDGDLGKFSDLKLEGLKVDHF